MAKAAIHLMNIDKKTYDKHTTSMCSHINVGSEEDISIRELSETIKEVVGFKGKIKFDLSKPDGTLKKLLDSKRIKKFGFKPEISLKKGLIRTYQNYIKNYANI